MSAAVPALRPEFDTSSIKVGEPVTGPDWATLGGLANYCNGHGGMLIPWCAIGATVAAAGSATFHFYVAPKSPAVERVWVLNMRSDTAGATAAVTVGSASSVTVTPGTSRTGRTTSYAFREQLAAKTNTAADAAVTVAATGGAITVESLCCYEQTRRVLVSADNGVDLTTLRPRQPVFDGTNESVAGVIDAYKNLDARRAGLFAWSTPVAAPLEFTSGSFAKVFPLSPPTLGALFAPSDTACTVRCAAYAKVNANAGIVRFTADSSTDSVSLQVTSTSFAWVTGDLDIDAEDLSVTDGRRGSVWEGLTIEANDDDATALSIAGLAVVRITTPI